MKRTFLLIITICTIIASCKNKSDNRKNVFNYSSPKKDRGTKNISIELLRQIDYIADHTDNPKDTLYYNVFFYSKNDSSFIDISYDKNVPLIFSPEQYLGFIQHNNYYLFFFNNDPKQNMELFFNVQSANDDINDIEKIVNSTENIDGKTYTFYSPNLDSLKLINIRTY